MGKQQIYFKKYNVYLREFYDLDIECEEIFVI